MVSPSAEIISKWIDLFKNDEKYRIAKTIDIYLSLPRAHRRNLAKFINEEVGGHREWESRINDDSQHISLARSICFYFSGRIEVGQPNPGDLCECLSKYLKSDMFVDAEDNPHAESIGKEISKL